MNSPTTLLKRLEEIGASLAASEHGLALIGLGSVGQDLGRLDVYSDLDFFAIVAEGTAGRFIDDLAWLERVHPVAYAFRNTPDGYKLLFADGIFCEFAVFEQASLEDTAYTPGRIIWKRGDIPDTIAIPRRPLPPHSPVDVDWHLGEALTNLYVGLQRFRRGEKLSALRFIQVYAVDKVVALAATIAPPAVGASPDPFSGERRFEQRFPALAPLLPGMMQGYDGCVQSAAALLAFLEQRFEVDPVIAGAIRTLLEG